MARLATRPTLILILLFLMSLPAVTPRIYASDEIEYFAFLRSLWFDRDVSFENEYRRFYDRGVLTSSIFHETFLERTTPTGRRENFGTLGCALLWSPFYVATDAFLRVGGRGQPAALDGFSQPYIAAASYASAFYGFLAVLFSAMVARRVVPNASAGSVLFGTLAVWVGTPLLFYMYVTPPMPHASSAFAVSAFVLAWLQVRRSWSRRGLAGLAALGALMTIVREQDAFFMIGPAIDFVWPRRAEPGLKGLAHEEGPISVGQGFSPGWLAGRSLRVLLVDVIAAAVAFGVVFLPQAIAYLRLNGRIGPSPLVSRKMTWTTPHAAQVLGSPEHGLLFWTPLATLAIAGVIILAWHRPGAKSAEAAGADGRRIALGLLAMVALQIYIAGSVESWTVAGAFGQRRFVSLTVILVVGLTALATVVRAAAGRVALASAVMLTCWWNVALMIQFGSGLMDRQRLELATNTYHAFVTVPRRLPEMISRYMLRRESFYAPARPVGQ